MEHQVIIALDFPDPKEAESFLQNWEGEFKPFIKVGYQLFYQVGPDWVARRKEEGYQVFLDLKLHDIPQTVAGAVQSLTKLEVDFLTLHAAGGSKMIQAAKQAASHSQMKLLAVTQLTSTDQHMLNHELQIVGTVEDSVAHLGKLAYEAGADGIVCSGHEVKKIKELTSTNFLAVTPGIRPLQSQKDDQKRVMTPEKAIQAGADFLVVGRPITRAKSPFEVYQQIIDQIQQERELE